MAQSSGIDPILGNTDLVPPKFKEAITLAYAQYGKSQSLGQLDELLMRWRAVLALAETESLTVQALQALFVGLEKRSTLAGEAADLDERIDTLRRLTKFTHSRWDLARYFINLGIALHARYKLQTNAEDLDSAITAFRQACEFRPGERILLECLLTAVCARADAFKKRGDFDEVIELAQRVLEFKDTSRRERYTSLLERYSFERFFQSPDAGDLDAFLVMSRKLSPADVSDESALYRGMALETRFNHSGESFDLGHAINHYAHLLKGELTLIDKVEVLDCSAGCYTRRFLESGDRTDDIDIAIALTKEAIELSSDESERRIRTIHLALRYNWRAGRFHDRTDIDMATELFRSTKRPNGVDFELEEYPWYMGYGECLRLRYQHLNDTAALRERISILEEYARRMPEDEEQRQQLLFFLASARKQALYHYAKHHDPATPGPLGRLLRSGAKEVMQAFVDAANAARPLSWSSELEITEEFSEFYVNFIRFIPSRDVAENIIDPGDVKKMQSLFLEQMSEAMGLGHTLSRRYEEAARLQATVGATVATMLLLKDNDTALEWFEQGRAVVWSQIHRLRTPLDNLRREHPELADELAKLSSKLEATGRRAPLPSQGPIDISTPERTAPDEDLSAQGRSLAKSYTELLKEIRLKNGFQDFLRPKRADTLLKAAGTRAVVCINLYSTLCDALIIFGSKLRHVRLPRVTTAKVTEWHVRLSRYIQRKPARTVDDPRKSEAAYDPQHFVDIKGVLRELWDYVVRPILEVHLVTLKKGRRHITWCTTGQLAFLPLHAAGPYDGKRPNAFDLVISSYAPNLSSLLPPTTELGSPSRSIPALAKPSTQAVNAPQATVEESAKVAGSHDGGSLNASAHVASSSASTEAGPLPRQTVVKPSSSPSILVVAQPNTPYEKASPLPGTVEESVKVAANFPIGSAQVLLREDGTTEAVGAHMEKHPYIHLACHGKQDADPMQSAFLLYDKPLTLHTLMEHKSSNAQLAFLSACETATGDEKVPNEAVHLAAGMLAAGYKSVVATMWSIGDAEAPRVADEFYKALLADPERDVASALHTAVKKLRESEDVGIDAFVKWMPYIHFGL